MRKNKITINYIKKKKKRLSYKRIYPTAVIFRTDGCVSKKNTIDYSFDLHYNVDQFSPPLLNWERKKNRKQKNNN